MRKYFWLQCKRVLRLVPGVLLAGAVLLVALGVLFGAVYDGDREGKELLSIGMVGTADDPILEMGLTALQTMDDSRYTVEILAMTEPQAQQALEAGEISAYVVIPEGFMAEAMYGRFMPISYVGTMGAGDLVSLFKEEFTRVIGDIVMEARKGVYGLSDAMSGHPDRKEQMNDLALRYVEYVLVRGDMYALETLGIARDLDLMGYLQCGLTVLLLLLLCLPFAAVLVGRDGSLALLLRARGMGVWKQTVCEFSAYFLGLLLLTEVVAAAVSFVPGLSWGQLQLWHLVPVVFCIAGLSFFLYGLSRELISGVLLQFFLFLALAFVSGCMYPVFFFPESVQKIAGWLPTGMARDYLGAAMMGNSHTCLWLVAVGLAALVGAGLVRSRQLRRVGR